MATLLEMAAEILAAQASSTQMTSEELLAQLKNIHATLIQLETGTVTDQPVEEKPLLSGKQSIKRNEIVCLVCNKGGFKTLTRHLNTAHKVTPKDYRKQFGIPAKQPLSAKSLTESRKKIAIDKGLGDKLVQARVARAINVAAKKEKAVKAPKIKVKGAKPVKIA